MTAARLIAATPALIVGASLLILCVLVFVEARRARRTEARAAERRARPHSANVATAAEDAAAITRTALDKEQHRA